MTTNRFSISIAVIVIAALALLTISMLSQSHPSVSKMAGFSLQQRLGEWTAGVTAQQAYQDQRQGEQAAGHAYNAEQGYLAYGQGEWNAGVNPELAYLNFRRGEWTGN